MALLVMTGENTFQYYEDGRPPTEVDVITQEEASSMGFEPGDMYRRDDPRNKRNRAAAAPSAPQAGASAERGQFDQKGQSTAGMGGGKGGQASQGSVPPPPGMGDSFLSSQMAPQAGPSGGISSSPPPEYDRNAHNPGGAFPQPGGGQTARGGGPSSQLQYSQGGSPVTLDNGLPVPPPPQEMLGTPPPGAGAASVGAAPLGSNIADVNTGGAGQLFMPQVGGGPPAGPAPGLGDQFRSSQMAPPVGGAAAPVDPSRLGGMPMPEAAPFQPGQTLQQYLGDPNRPTAQTTVSDALYPGQVGGQQFNPSFAAQRVGPNINPPWQSAEMRGGPSTQYPNGYFVRPGSANRR